MFRDYQYTLNFHLPLAGMLWGEMKQIFQDGFMALLRITLELGRHRHVEHADLFADPGLGRPFEGPECKVVLRTKRIMFCAG